MSNVKQTSLRLPLPLLRDAGIEAAHLEVSKGDFYVQAVEHFVKHRRNERAANERLAKQAPEVAA